MDGRLFMYGELKFLLNIMLIIGIKYIFQITGLLSNFLLVYLYGHTVTFIFLFVLTLFLIVYSFNKIPEYNFTTFSSAEELKKYKDLLDSSAITEAEYQIQKERILRS